MVIDTAPITMFDGTMKPAIDVFPGGEVVTLFNNKLRSAPIIKKTVENHNDVVCLILSNGERLVGSRDQRVATFKNRRSWYTQMADIEVGSELMGFVAGSQVVVRVVGVMYHPTKQVRLVGFELQKNDCFVAGGLLCR